MMFRASLLKSHLVISPSVGISLLGGLSFLRDLFSPNSTFSTLIVPVVAWTLIFLASALSLRIESRRHSLSIPLVDIFGSISRNEINFAICFLLSNLCGIVDDPDRQFWSYTLLPLAVALTKALSPIDHEQRPVLQTALMLTATLLCIHCTMVALDPSMVQLFLGIVKAIFLSRALLQCEMMGEEPPVIHHEKAQLPTVSSSIRSTFWFRLRNISFLLSVVLAASQITLYSLDSSDPFVAKISIRQLVVILIECTKWFLVCFLLLEQHYDATIAAVTLAAVGLVGFVFRSHKYSLAVESSVALLLFLNPFGLLSMQKKHMHMLLCILILVCGASSIAFLNHRSPTLEPINIHPIEELIQKSREEFSEVLARQSRTLDEAVREYKRRTGMHPPPKFDEWFAFAQARNVQMIDEYDIIQEVIRPFWGLPPSIIRQNARDAIEAEDSPYTAFLVRDGEIVRTAFGGWFNDPLAELLQLFARHLPEMDLVFNHYDEPSVVIPHDLLAMLVSNPLKMSRTPQNVFSEHPSYLIGNITTHYGTRVLNIDKQPPWSQLIQSCPLDSPVRDLFGGTDDTASYARSPLGFIYNTTAFKEVCNQPSLPMHHGFFDRPDTLKFSSTLLPVFSVAKPSTFNDIIFPSPWHYSDRVPYDESRDMDWHLKQNQMHWRGSTTTGYTTNGGWRRHHRHRFVTAFNKINHPVNILKKGNEGNWIEDTMAPADAQALFDVKFTRILESSSSDEAREAQAIEFDIVPAEDQQDIWKWKYLLDVDGHGLSGRFYAMLKSRSLVFKCTMFREWHDEWLWPWVHYIPLGLDGSDWFEAVRFFALEKTGEFEAQRIGADSSVWAKKVLRKEDMEAWMFRLLLEYARVIDDRRDSLGFEM